MLILTTDLTKELSCITSIPTKEQLLEVIIKSNSNHGQLTSSDLDISGNISHNGTKIIISESGKTRNFTGEVLVSYKINIDNILVNKELNLDLGTNSTPNEEKLIFSLLEANKGSFLTKDDLSIEGKINQNSDTIKVSEKDKGHCFTGFVDIQYGVKK